MATARLTISPRYFQEIVRKKYVESLGFIWAREVFQNASDAGAKRLDIRTGEDERGPWIEAVDDGSGMPTVMNMLGIGAATKPAGAGGFGTAKEVVVLSWPYWEIVSRGERVTSEILAREGEIDELATPIRGTKIKVWHGGDLRLSDVERYLALTNGLRVYVNGRRWSFYRRGTHKASFEWADVYVNGGKSAAGRGHILVRWEGITMFARRMEREDIQVSVQLKGKCIDMLTETRESLRYPYSHDLYDIIREFEKNPLSRGERNEEDLIDLFVGDGVVTVEGSARDSMEDWLLRQESGARDRAVHQVASSSDADVDETVALAADRIAEAYRAGYEFDEIFGGNKDSGTSPLLPVEQLVSALPEDVRAPFEAWGAVQRSEAAVASQNYAPPSHAATEMLMSSSEADSGKRRGVSLSKPGVFGPRQVARQKVYPGDYAIKRVNGRKCSLDLSSEKYGRMLFGWEAAVEASIKALEEFGYNLSEQDRRFRVGFVVEGPVRAENLSVGTQRFFLLNPRMIKASMGLADIAKTLLALATHEVAHIYYDHGEAFDALWMELMTRVSIADLMSDDRVRCVPSANRELAFSIARRRRSLTA